MSTKPKSKNTKLKFRCPCCNSEEVTVALVQSFMANIMEHYCFSYKPQDSDAPAGCTECNWQGTRADLKTN